METTVFESRARELVADIKEIVRVKGINLDNALQQARIPKERSDKFLNGSVMPSLSEFIALCEISGITFHLPSIETPNTAM